MSIRYLFFDDADLMIKIKLIIFFEFRKKTVVEFKASGRKVL
jgi:hypothetical protein